MNQDRFVWRNPAPHAAPSPVGDHATGIAMPSYYDAETGEAIHLAQIRRIEDKLDQVLDLLTRAGR